MHECLSGSWSHFNLFLDLSLIPPDLRPSFMIMTKHEIRSFNAWMNEGRKEMIYLSREIGVMFD